jgi:formylmethanofuran dehydrogenase subunit E-like metal-binding protein
MENTQNSDIKELIAQVEKSANEELNFCNTDTTPLVCQMISTAEGREKIVDLIVEYVGTNGMSISEAIVAIENERNSNINEIG